jgi:hypothetical protein
VGRAPGGAYGTLRGGGGVACMRDKSILNQIWAQDKIHNLVCTLLGMLFFWVLTPVR